MLHMQADVLLCKVSNHFLHVHDNRGVKRRVIQCIHPAIGQTYYISLQVLHLYAALAG